MELNNENLTELVSKGTHLLDFYAQWCGPCKMLAPVLEEIKEEINIIKIDIDSHIEEANLYKIMSVPTLVFIKDGVKTKEVSGYHSKEELLEIIEQTKNA